MRIGLLFSGQGAQYPGMGQNLYSTSSSARKIFDTAGETLKNLIFNGSEEELNRTDITQPSVYTVGVAAWKALREAAHDSNIDFDKSVVGTAGFSLGEYGALTVSGVIDDFAMGLDIVRNRGNFMSEAGKYADGSPRGAMAAVIGARENAMAAIDEARGDDILEAVNYNAPTQISVAGDASAILRLRECGKERRLKVIPLKVSTAFHSPIMEPASVQLYGYVSSFSFNKPTVTTYSNTTANDIMYGDRAAWPEFASSHDINLIDAAPEDEDVSEFMRQHMALQLKSPVLFEDIIENMVADGVDRFIETGPGKTLCGLVSKISPYIPTVSIDTDGIEAALSLMTQ